VEQQAELRSREPPGKEPYDPPRLVRHGSLRDVTGFDGTVYELRAAPEG
jgi:hypothetical protein